MDVGKKKTLSGDDTRGARADRNQAGEGANNLIVYKRIGRKRKEKSQKGCYSVGAVQRYPDIGTGG